MIISTQPDINIRVVKAGLVDYHAMHVLFIAHYWLSCHYIFDERVIKGNRKISLDTGYNRILRNKTFQWTRHTAGSTLTGVDNQINYLLLRTNKQQKTSSLSACIAMIKLNEASEEEANAKSRGCFQSATCINQEDTCIHFLPSLFIRESV